MPDPVSAVSGAATQAARTQTPSFADSLDSDMFLNLLVAQLKYQDPTAPTDSTEFLAQTAQFTMVEKLTAIAEQTEAAAVTGRNLGAASLVGKTISWLAEDGTTGTGTVSRARLGSAGPVLTVDGRDVPFDLVSAVAGPAPAAPAPAPAAAPATTAPPTTPSDPGPATEAPSDAA